MEFQICHCKILCTSQDVFLLQHGEVIAKSWQTPSDTLFCIYRNVWHLAMNRVISLTFLGLWDLLIFDFRRHEEMIGNSSMPRSARHWRFGGEGNAGLGRENPGANSHGATATTRTGAFLGLWMLWECTQNLFRNNARSRSNVFKPFCNLSWNQETFLQQDVEDNDNPAIQACLPGSRTQHSWIASHSIWQLENRAADDASHCFLLTDGQDNQCCVLVRAVV